MTADLHVHTRFSDGTESPSAVVAAAKQGGLKTIAITDHDVVAGIAEAKVKGLELGVEIIPGIEFSTEVLNTEIHILGYFIDVNNPKLLATIEKIQRARETRVIEICAKLNALGIPLDAEKVFELAGHRAAGRPHVARALLKEGFISTFNEAFNRYINFNGPAYVSHYKLSPTEAIALIKEAGGLSVYAHPVVSKADQLIPELVKVGLDGIEVYYYYYNPVQIEHYEKIASEHNLLMTGGSDYHGVMPGRDIKLGDFTVPDELVDKLKNEYLHRNKS